MIFLSATDDASKIVALKKVFTNEKSYYRIVGQSFVSNSVFLIFEDSTLTIL